jgi:outer membrane protein assembly factor BamB
MLRFTSWLVIGCVACGGVRADKLTKGLRDNWHQWRGPEATGFAPTADPPLMWDAKTNIKWKAELPGRGASTPIVWGDRIFLLTALDTGRAAEPQDIPKPDPRFEIKTKPPTTYHKWLVLCLDRKTGAVLWKQVAAEQVPHEGRHETNTYAGSSPMTDGRHLYVSFGSRGVYCYDLDGKLQWKRTDLGLIHTRYGWGEATTPVVHGDAVVLTWDQEKESFIICLDAKTGQTRWKKDRDEPTTWATPLIVEHKGTTQVIVNGTKRVRSYELATGKVIWECGGQTLNAIPSPVATEGVVYCMTGYRGAAAVAVPLDATGDLTDTDKVLWRYDRGTPYVPSPLLDDGRLYFTQANNALLTILDIKTGKAVLDRERLPGLNSLYASPMGAKDRIYLVGRDGTTLVLKRGDKLDVLATNRLDEGIDASPVAVDKQLFLRGEKHLYCIEAP